MKYRRFGKTELQMPLISMGGMRFQTSWKRKDPVTGDSQKNLEETVRRALELGINHFETARGYGTSEEQLGRILPGLDRSQIFVQTKVGIRTNGDDFMSDFEDSLKTLGVDYLDLFAIHGINDNSCLGQALEKGGTIERALKLREEGVIRNLGFSTHGPCKTILRTINTGFFDYVNLWYSYIYQDNQPAISAARELDMGVFIISPNDKGGKLYAPPEKLVRLTAPLHPMVFNDLFILQNKDIHTISCGVTGPADFDIHVKAVAEMDLLKEDVARIRKQLDGELEKSEGADRIKDYTTGIPDWDQTPGNINVKVILWLLTLAEVFDLTAYAKMRYNLLGNGGHWFPGENAEKADQLAGEIRKAVSDSPFSDRIADALCRAHAVLGGEEVRRMGEDH